MIDTSCHDGQILINLTLKNSVGDRAFLLPPRRIEQKICGLSNEPPAKEPHFNLSFWFKVSNENLDVTPDTIKNLVLTFNLKNSNQIAVIFVTKVELKKITNQPVCASWLEFSMVKKSTQIMGASFGTTTENRTPVPSVRGWCPNR